MAIQHVEDEYMIPRGRVYFDEFDENGDLQGEEDFGNCPDFNLNIETEKSIHYKSTTGLREKDHTTIVQINRTGTLVCDNISKSTRQRWLAGELVAKSQNNTSVSGVAMTLQQGKHYQLGQTADNPAGHRNISSLSIVEDAESEPDTYVAGTDFNVDLVKGRIQWLRATQNVKVSYSKAEKSWSQIKTGAVAELEGALRIISDNATGDDLDHYMPHVVLTPEGDMSLITSDTEYITLTFSVEVLTPANGSAIYLDDQPVESV